MKTCTQCGRVDNGDDAIQCVACGSLFTRHPKPDGTFGSWMDEFGGCKLCGGEIPHGHSGVCDIYKMDCRINELESVAKKLYDVLVYWDDTKWDKTVNSGGLKKLTQDVLYLANQNNIGGKK